MALQFVSLPTLARVKRRLPMLLAGFGLAIAGVLLVEVLAAFGARPLTPIGWPSLGMIFGAAIGGAAALAGGALAVGGYYLLNLAHPERFPLFYEQAANAVAWFVALSLLCGAALAIRPRFLRLAALLESEEQARVAKERLELALDGSNVVLWDTDMRTGRVYLSEAWSRIVGDKEGETITTTEQLLSLLHPDDREAVRRTSLEVLRGVRPVYAVEHRVRTKSGDWRWVISRGRITERDPASGRVLRMIGTNVDITERKRMEEAAHSAAQSDPLTGLANRRAFNDALHMALARGRRSGNDLAVLYLDLDRFKEVNDKFGHAAGDRLLKHVALRLRGCVRASDTVARFGGDEFVVLLEELRDREHAVAVVEKIVEDMRRPFSLEGFDIEVTTSVGLAYAHAGVDGDSLIQRADKALYEAKQAGRNCYSVG